jgi:hypothetical protein
MVEAKDAVATLFVVASGILKHRNNDREEENS